MTLSQTTLQWGGLTFYGSRGIGFTIDTLIGWRDWDTRQDTTKRPRSHGWFDSPTYAEGKTVMAAGPVSAGDDRDALLAQLETALVPGALADLTVTEAGRTLTTSARLVRREIPNVAWGVGVFRWAAQWTCPDPLRYGDVTVARTYFPDRAGGLRFPLYSDGAGTDVGALDFGPASTTGRLTLSNAGNADSMPQFQVDGPVAAEGFEIQSVSTGARIRYEGALSSGAVLVIDSATGTVFESGIYDRADVLKRREWEPVPAKGGSMEWSFIPLGARSGAQLTATVRPAYW